VKLRVWGSWPSYRQWTSCQWNMLPWRTIGSSVLPETCRSRPYYCNTTSVLDIALQSRVGRGLDSSVMGWVVKLQLLWVGLGWVKVRLVRFYVI